MLPQDLSVTIKQVLEASSRLSIGLGVPNHTIRSRNYVPYDVAMNHGAIQRTLVVPEAGHPSQQN